MAFSFCVCVRVCVCVCVRALLGLNVCRKYKIMVEHVQTEISLVRNLIYSRYCKDNPTSMHLMAESVRVYGGVEATNIE